MLRFHQHFMSIDRSNKRILMMLIDAVCLPVCLLIAYSLRVSAWWPMPYVDAHSWLFPFVSVVGLVSFSAAKIYRTVLRYFSGHALLQIAKGLAPVVIALWVASALIELPVVPRSVPIIFGFVAFVYLAGVRFAYRAYYRWILQTLVRNETVIIYGAGRAGVQISAAISDSMEYRVVCFVDDDPRMVRAVVNGLPVYSTADLGNLIEKHNISKVLLAIPSANLTERRRALERIAACHVSALSVPSTPDLLSGRVRVNQLQEVAIEDLLGREPVEPFPELMAESLKDKVVLVTGAGGSIGSELCRQIHRAGPRKLILLDVNEYALYAIDQMLGALGRDTEQTVERVCVLGSIINADMVNNVLARHAVNSIYHAAAYKHVPIIEENIFSGIRNNVFGTRVLCDAAYKHGIERMVMISTDKAVRPSSVMGATKRVAELIIQDAAQRAREAGRDTIFTMVRFGNVLESSGSVVPFFRKQIAAGGPVTVTHPEVTRYFMTISEAASLVIQAGSLAKGGEVFLLHMGKEVLIRDLAEQMIRLSGYEVKSADNPDGDIEIVYSGLRPGEKIYEELLIDDATHETPHPRILYAMERKVSSSQLKAVLDRLDAAEYSNDSAQARDELLSYVA